MMENKTQRFLIIVALLIAAGVAKELLG